MVAFGYTIRITLVWAESLRNMTTCVCPLDEQDVLGVFRPEAQNTAIIISKKAFDATSRNEETKGTQPSFSSLSNAMEEDKEVRPRSAAAYIPHSARAGYFLQEGGNPLPVPAAWRSGRKRGKTQNL